MIPSQRLSALQAHRSPADAPQRHYKGYPVAEIADALYLAGEGRGTREEALALIDDMTSPPPFNRFGEDMLDSVKSSDHVKRSG